MSRGKRPFEDDGRTIANMDIDGMPWHDRRRDKSAEADASGQPPPKKIDMPWLGGVLSAVGRVALVFAGAFAAFLLLLRSVW